MARITFDVSREIKQKIKGRLGAEGHTFKDIFSQFCEQYSEFGLSPGEHIKWENRSQTPDISAVYFVFDNLGSLIYIGRTHSLKKRLQGTAHHRRDEFKKLNVTVYWIKAPIDLITNLENRMIKELNPKLNKARHQTRTRQRGISLEESMIQSIQKFADSEGRSWSQACFVLMELGFAAKSMESLEDLVTAVRDAEQWLDNYYDDDEMQHAPGSILSKMRLALTPFQEVKL